MGYSFHCVINTIINNRSFFDFTSRLLYTGFPVALFRCAKGGRNRSSGNGHSYAHPEISFNYNYYRNLNSYEIPFTFKQKLWCVDLFYQCPIICVNPTHNDDEEYRSSVFKIQIPELGLSLFKEIPVIEPDSDDFVQQTIKLLCSPLEEDLKDSSKDSVSSGSGSCSDGDSDIYFDYLRQLVSESSYTVFDRNLFFLDFMVFFYMVCFFFVSLLFKRYAFKRIVFIYKYCFLCVGHLTIVFLISFFFYFPVPAALFSNMFFIVSYKTAIFKHILFLLMLFILVFSLNYGFFYRNLFFLFDFPFLLLFLVFNLFLLLGTNDVFVLFLIIELISFTLYILMGLRRRNLFIIESSLKYFVLNALISNIVLVAIASLFASVGSLSFDDISFSLLFLDPVPSNIIYSGLFICGLFFIFFVLVFKLGAAPVHFWVVDVYEGTSLPVLSTLVLLVKSSYLLFLIRFMDLISLNYLIIFLMEHLCILFGIFSLVVGSIGSLYQRKIKRFFAYASISHVGFLFLGLGCGIVSWSYVLFYFFVYLMLNLALFCFLENFVELTTGRRFIYISDFVFLRESPDLTKYAFLILVFSFAGLPPTVGFVSKGGILLLLINSGFYLLFIVSIIFTLISCFYYFRILKTLLYNENQKSTLSRSSGSPLNISNLRFGWVNLLFKYFFFL